MSITTFVEERFVEAMSADLYVRELHRRAMRVLNDPSLDRQQRELHMRSIQSALKAHLEKAGEKERRAAEKKARRAKTQSAQRNQGVPHPSQVVARRKELAYANPAGDEPTKVPQPHAPVAVIAPVARAANDCRLSGRNRPLLTLKRA